MTWYKPRQLSFLLDLQTTLTDVSALPKISEVIFKLEYDHLETKEMDSTVSYSSLDQYSRMSPFESRVTSFSVLSQPGALKRVYSVKVDVSLLKDWNWMPGDAFGILPENDTEVVRHALDLLSLEHEEMILVKVIGAVTKESLAEFFSSYDKPLSIGQLFTKYLDLTYFPKKVCLRHLADFCTDESEKNILLYLSSKEGSSMYMKLAGERTTILDFLSTFKSCKPDLTTLLSYLPLLHPRFYSIASTPLINPGEIEFVFSTFDYETPEGYRRKGIASSYIESLLLISRKSLQLVPRPNSTIFRPPQNPQDPCIMICAGTGIAPFIGFLRHFSARNASANSWLFFGFRNLEHDYLFRSEIEALLEKGTLRKLSPAVSRQPELGYPKYVQDAFIQVKHEIYNLIQLNPTVRIYICGDELTMVKGINDAIIEMICEELNVSQKEAMAISKQWTTEGRIVRDVWI